jgi:hypothetical protein
MTIRIQPSGVPDRILARVGKKRAVFIPSTSAQHGCYVACREGFFRALVRPRGKAPPSGWVYWDELSSGETMSGLTHRTVAPRGRGSTSG